MGNELASARPCGQANCERQDTCFDVDEFAPGPRGLGHVLKSLVQPFLHLNWNLRVPICNIRRFEDKDLHPTHKSILRSAKAGLEFGPGGLCVWTGEWNAHLYNALFLCPPFVDPDCPELPSLTEHPALTDLPSLTDQSHRAGWGALGKIKAVIFRGNLHIAMVGHLAREGNPGTENLKACLETLLVMFLAMEQQAKDSGMLRKWCEATTKAR